jgi:hypothetical protein
VRIILGSMLIMMAMSGAQSADLRKELPESYETIGTEEWEEVVETASPRRTRRVELYACTTCPGSALPLGGLRKTAAPKLPYGGLGRSCPPARRITRAILVRKG